MAWFKWTLIILFVVALILFLVYLPFSFRFNFWKETALSIVKSISIIISAIAGLALLIVFFLAYLTTPKVEEPPKEKPEIKPVFVRERWEEVLEHIKEKSFALAIIEADNVLDEALKNLGYRGESIGDRLKRISAADLPMLNELWEVHKIRNQIVHDGYKIGEEETIKALKTYKKALLELGII